MLNLVLHVACAILLRNEAGGSLPLLGSAVFTTSLVFSHERSTVVQQGTLAAAFGLIHGFAFASAFGTLLPNESILTELVGFNLGVEAGQLLVVLCAITGLSLIDRIPRPTLGALARSITAGGILAMGLSWTFTRVMSS